MHFIRPFYLGLLGLPLAWAQLILPNPPYLPHNASTTTDPAKDYTWSNLLGTLLYFYDEHRSGTLPSDTNRVTWRNNSALEDGKDVGHDLTGGFYDGGVYVKDTFDLSFTLMSLCWSALDFGQGYELANQSAYLDDTLRWGLNWLIKAHSSNNTLYVQVGDSGHQYLGEDRSIPSPRHTYQVNSTNPGTDVAAQASAAFSACSALYANRTLVPSSSISGLGDSEYAANLQTHARDLYQFATTADKQSYRDAIPHAMHERWSPSMDGELAMAALFLALSETDPAVANKHFSDATEWYNKVKSSIKPTMRYNSASKEPGILTLAAQLLHAYPDVFTQGTDKNASTIALPWSQTLEEQYFGKIVSENPSDLNVYIDGDLNGALNVAALMMHYSSIKADYVQYATGLRDYALGDNPMNVPYVVGIHPNSPVNPHSALASPNDTALRSISVTDTDPVPEAHVLYGAVVGGPDEDGNFWDLRADGTQNGVALAHNAPLLALAAHALVAARAGSKEAGGEAPFYASLTAARERPSGLPCNQSVTVGCLADAGRRGLSWVGIALSVLGALLVVGGVALCCCCWVRRRRRHQQRKPAREGDNGWYYLNYVHNGRAAEGEGAGGQAPGYSWARSG